MRTKHYCAGSFFNSFGPQDYYYYNTDVVPFYYVARRSCRYDNFTSLRRILSMYIYITCSDKRCQMMIIKKKRKKKEIYCFTRIKMYRHCDVVSTGPEYTNTIVCPLKGQFARGVPHVGRGGGNAKKKKKN